MVQISSWITTWVTLAVTTCIYIPTLSSETKVDAFVIQTSSPSKSRFTFGSTKGGAQTQFPEDSNDNDERNDRVHLNSNIDASAVGSNENLVIGQQSRRSAIETSGKILAGLLLASTVSVNQAAQAASSGYSDLPPQTIVMTGSNSGIGYDAAKRMAERGHTIILACRTLDKATDAANRIKDELSSSVQVNLIPKECNLASLKSIQKFTNDMNESSINIDALCLNAGISRNTSAKDVLRTNEGFELTIGTNHLGHFYMVQKMLPLLEKGQGKRIVVTASGVHDPESPGGAQGSKATLGDLSGLEKMTKDGVPFDMIDGGDYDADKAYKDSKLCNVLFTRELQRRLNDGGKKINVNCFNPGLIVSTGLFRDQNQVFTKIFDFAATDLLKVGETVHWGGGALEYMTLDSSVISKGGLYYTSPPGSSKYGDDAFGNQFAKSDVSKEAKDDNKAKRLWELSEQLVSVVA